MAGSVVGVEGTSEVDPKLLFPVEGLVAYLEEKHGLTGDGKTLSLSLSLCVCVYTQHTTQ